MVASKLNFNGRVSSMCNKAGRQLIDLQRIKGPLDYASPLSVYKNFVL